MKKSLGAKPLVYPTPVFLVASYNEDGSANVMNAAWGGICSSDPVSVAVSIRPQRHTFANIVARGAFTINIPNVKQAAVADYFGLVSGRDCDKIKNSEMAVEKAEFVNAPLLVECPLVLECRLVAQHQLGVHTQFIGEVADVKIEDYCLNENGTADIRLVDPLLFAPGNSAYFAIGDFVGKAFALGCRVGEAG